jgi:hypothetical protein
MHDGKMPTLRSVHDFYNRGSDARDVQIKSLSTSIRPLGLTTEEVDALLEFLKVQ